VFLEFNGPDRPQAPGDKRMFSSALNVKKAIYPSPPHEVSGCTAKCAKRASELCRAVQSRKPEIKGTSRVERSAGLAHEKSAISEYIIEIDTQQKEGNEHETDE
jgi:hypothetical protein